MVEHAPNSSGDEGVGCTAAQFARAGADQVAADLFAEDALQPIAGDGLVIGDGGQHRNVEFAQVEQLISDIRRNADRRRIDGPRPEHPAPGDRGNVKCPTLQIPDQEVNRRPLFHDPGQVLARHQRCRAKSTASIRRIHSRQR